MAHRGATAADPSRPIRRVLAAASVLGLGLALVSAAPVGANPAADSDREPPQTEIPSEEDVDRAQQESAAASADVAEVEAALAAANDRMRQLNIAASTAVEDYNQAVHERREAEAVERAAQEEAKAAREAVAEQRQMIGRVMATNLQQHSNLEELRAFVSADGAQELLERAGAVAMTSTSLSTKRQALEAAQAHAKVTKEKAAAAAERRAAAADAAEGAKERATAALAEQESAVRELDTERAGLVARLAELEDISVELAEQRQLGLERRAQERAEAESRRAEEEAEEEQAGNDDQSGTEERSEEPPPQPQPQPQPEPAPDPEPEPRPEPSPEPSPTPPAPKPEPRPKPPPPPDSSRGATVVAFAKEQLGKPYVFGASGPDAYDCSGLTLRAWAQVGVSMPHTARGQLRMSTQISSSQLQPGDLIFWANNPSDIETIYHVALYIGGGEMIHAPRPGRTVEIRSVWYMGTPSHYARPPA